MTSPIKNEALNLRSEQISRLQNLIRDSFRIRPNHDPVYVQIGNSLTRLLSKQHQVAFGRRGSGKSSQLVQVHKTKKNQKGTHSIYLDIDQIKKLPFPDILTRILISIFEQLPVSRMDKALFWRNSKPIETANELRILLDLALNSTVEKKTSRKTSLSAKMAAEIEGAANFGVQGGMSSGVDIKELYRRSKLEYLERHLEDYKAVLQKCLISTANTLYVLVDDFYLIKRDIQPDVADYLHRLLRGTDAYLKIGTIRHRTSLRRHDRQTIGLELGQDVEEISLDKTLEDFAGTQRFLISMLDELGKKCGVESTSSSILNSGAAHALTLSSGGVPRDFLNVFTEAISLSISKGKYDRITPTYVYKAAALLLQNKRSNLSEDAGVDAETLELIYANLIKFCLTEKKKTCFLISKEESQSMVTENELLLQLMDFKLIHLVAPDTSAASGRAGRFSAYTLDASLFMEPRLRNIDIVKFWEQDDNSRPIGLREAPIFSLSSISKIKSEQNDTNNDSLNSVLKKLDTDREVEQTD